MNYKEAKAIKRKLIRAIDEPVDLSEKLQEDDDELECEAFRAGTHTDSAGNSDTWTKDDLEKIAKTYNEKVASQPAPVCVGHPENSSPAYGWVKRAFVEGDKLKVKLHQLNKNFVDMLKNGTYKNRSISLYEDGAIRHLAFLGGSQPAIKGLAPIQFNEEDKFKTYSFTEDNMADDKVEDLKKELSWYERLFDRFGLEVKKDKEFAEFKKPAVEKMEDGPKGEESNEPKEEGESENAEAVKMETEDPKESNASIVVDKEAASKDKTDMAAISQENEKLKGEVAALKSEVEALQKQISEAGEASKAAGNRAFCEGLVRDGKLLPAQLEETIENLEARNYIDSLQTTRSFSEGEVPKSSVATYKEFLAAQPKLVEFGEVPNEPRKDALVAFPKSALEIEDYVEKKIGEVTKLNPAISYEEAMKTAYAECEKGAPEAYCEYMKSFTCK